MGSPASVRRRARSGVLAWSLLASIVSANGQQSPAQNGQEWVGKRVVTRFGAVLRIGNQVVDNQKLEYARGGWRSLNRFYRVEQVNGPWLWLQEEKSRVAGWVTADWVIPQDQAIDYFTNEIRVNPYDSSAYIRRGQIWRDKKEYDLAIADYNEAIRLEPANEVGWCSRGYAWRAKKEYDRAIADYGEAIRLDPSYVNAYIHRGNTWSEQKEYDKAITDYSEAIRLETKDARAYNNRGAASSLKKEYDKAITDYDEAIRLDPKNADT